jgi:hypothetical protein
MAAPATLSLNISILAERLIVSMIRPPESAARCFCHGQADLSYAMIDCRSGRSIHPRSGRRCRQKLAEGERAFGAVRIPDGSSRIQERTSDFTEDEVNGASQTAAREREARPFAPNQKAEV